MHGVLLPCLHSLIPYFISVCDLSLDLPKLILITIPRVAAVLCRPTHRLWLPLLQQVAYFMASANTRERCSYSTNVVHVAGVTLCAM